MLRLPSNNQSLALGLKNYVGPDIKYFWSRNICLFFLLFIKYIVRDCGFLSQQTFLKGQNIYFQLHIQTIIYITFPRPAKSFWTSIAVFQVCYYKKVFWKYEENLHENTHAKVRFQQSCKATLFKSHFYMGVLMYIFKTPFSKSTFCFWKITLYLKL